MSSAVQQPPPVPVSTVSSLAVWSLVLGILSFFCGPLAAIPAVICGHVAISKIDKSMGALVGRGKAVAGLIMGYVALALSLLVWGVIMQAEEKHRKARCMSHLGNIAKAGFMWSMDNGGKPFPDFKSLINSGANTPKVFICKSSGHQPGDFANVDEWADYVLVPVAVRGTNAEDVVAFDKPQNHAGRGGNVLHVDGSVSWLNTEEFNKTVAPFLKPSSGPSPGR